MLQKRFPDLGRYVVARRARAQKPRSKFRQYKIAQQVKMGYKSMKRITSFVVAWFTWHSVPE
jgi:hypothetical protein